MTNLIDHRWRTALVVFVSVATLLSPADGRAQSEVDENVEASSAASPVDVEPQPNETSEIADADANDQEATGDETERNDNRQSDDATDDDPGAEDVPREPDAVDQADARKRAPKRAQNVVLIEFNSDINAFSKEYLFRKLDKARELKPDILIIEIDSPGGEVEATMEIGARLRDIDWAHTVAFVPREALSGAALFSLGCDELVIASNAVYGDAGPVFLDEDFLFKHASEKVRSHLVRRARDLAESKGRPPALAEAMVDMNLEVFETVHSETGERKLLSEVEIEASGEADKWQERRLVPESRKDLFLEVNGRRAVELQLATINLSQRDDLKQYFGPIEEWTELTWSGIDTIVLVLNSPFVTAILLIMGLVGLYIEFSSPGLGVGGVLAAICFTVFFWSRFNGGTGEWLEVVLFLTGIALLLVEIFVIPGFGIWGISGGMLILAAIVMSSQTYVVPQTQRDLNQTVKWATVTMGSILGFMASAGFITRRMGRLPILRGLLLEPPQMATAGAAPATEMEQEGRTVRVGDTGHAESALRPAGRIILGGDYVDAISDGSFIDAGEPIQVVDVRANRVVVRRI